MDIFLLHDTIPVAILSDFIEYNIAIPSQFCYTDLQSIAKQFLPIM